MNWQWDYWSKKAKKKRRKLMLKALMVGLGVVLFWRGSWNLLDHVLFPDNPILSAMASLVVGLVILYGSNKLVDELM